MCKQNTFIGIVIVVAIFVSGCATMWPEFHVNVDSISSQEAGAKKTFVLLPGNKDTSAEDLQFREFASYVR